MRKNTLFNALLDVYDESDAFLLAEFLEKHLHKGSIRYDEINIKESQKKENHWHQVKQRSGHLGRAGKALQELQPRSANT